jgi:hypothetical protein
MIPRFQEYLHAHIHEQRWSHGVQYPQFILFIITVALFFFHIDPTFYYNSDTIFFSH